MTNARPRAVTPWPMCRSPLWMAATIFGLFIVIALSAGLVFNIVSVALPKIVDERLGAMSRCFWLAALRRLVFMCGALAQLAVGRLVERFPPHILFAVIAACSSRACCGRLMRRA